MAPKNRAEYRETVAKAFASVLTGKGLKWKETWGVANAAPSNAVTGARYHGVNRFYLGVVALTHGYKDPRWATMTQIMDVKGLYHPKEKWRLQKGSKAVFVEYWYPYDTQTEKQLGWKEYHKLPKEALEGDRYTLRVRYTPVFHASMIDGIPPLETPRREPRKLSEVVGTLSRSMGVALLYDGGNRAFYRRGEDKIHLPEPSAFHSEYEFNATALHELAHATGHPARLDRPMGKHFGSEEYALEELIAEICSCFMSVDLDVEQMPWHLENHKAYVQGWIKAIEEKPEALARAIAEAQRAATYMDYHAGLISEQEYNAGQNRSVSVPERKTKEAPGPPAQPEAAEADTFAIYQLRDGLGRDLDRDLRFSRMEDLARYGRTVELANYDKVYTGELEQGETLDGIFERFNIGRPSGFIGHSLSVSDIIVTTRGGELTAHYVDAIGFKELPELAKELEELEGYAGSKVEWNGNGYEIVGTTGNRLVLQSTTSDYHFESTLAELRLELPALSGEKMILTSAGKMPLAEYRDIMARRDGFEDYADMRRQGSDIRGGEEKAPDKKYQEAEIFGKPVLFSREKLTRDDVPEGWFKYDLRADEAAPDKPASIEYNVIRRFAGSILSPERIDLPEDSGYRRLGRGLRLMETQSTVSEFIYWREAAAIKGRERMNAPQKDPAAIRRAAEDTCACYSREISRTEAETPEM